jgi:hypothetical protein
LRDLGEYEEAKIICLEALEINQNYYGEDHTEYVRNLENLSSILFE